MRKMIGLTAAAALAVTLVPGPARAAETHRVFMTAFRFCNTPACPASENTTIKAGDTVEWVFTDAACVPLHVLGCHHTATRSGVGAFNSGPMPGATNFGAPNPKLTFARTFTTPGSYTYFCSVHTSGPTTMVATIVVT